MRSCVASVGMVACFGRRSRLGLHILLGLLVGGCGSESAPADETARRQGAVPPTEELATLDALAHLGYVDVAEVDGERAAGVVLADPSRADGGYTLVTSLTSASAVLVDRLGREVAGWKEGSREARWARVRLLANGDLLCVSPKPDALTRRRFDGTLVWRLPMEAHHDAIELPDGRLLALTRAFRSIPAIDPEHRSVDNHLAIVSADGRLLEEHSLYDLLQAEPRLTTVRRPPGLEDLPSGYSIDPIHANTVFHLAASPSAGHAEFRPGRVLVTLRYLDAVALFDLDEQRCVWLWGPGLLQGPHDGSILPNGHVLVLDNGRDERGWSRIVEYDPQRDELVWEYRAEPPERFHTSGRGTAQALSNGNILIGNSNSGEAFEVERGGELVWRYLNPWTDDSGARGVIRVERLARERVEPFLAR